MPACGQKLVNLKYHSNGFASLSQITNICLHPSLAQGISQSIPPYFRFYNILQNYLNSFEIKCSGERPTFLFSASTARARQLLLTYNSYDFARTNFYGGDIHSFCVVLWNG